MTDILARFEQYIADLLASVTERPEVIGLVLMGSTADRARVDEWSDHDFAVVTSGPDAAEGMRSDLTWLPGHDELVLTVRETHDGVKAIYVDGHQVEFGVTTLDDLANWYANSYEVALDRGGVAERMAQVESRAKPSDAADAGRDIRLFVALLLTGVGRARRGEALVAGRSIRGDAMHVLLSVWAQRVPAPQSHRLDNLDPFRRFEFVYPEAGRAMAAALALEPEAAARTLLALAEEQLAEGWAEWPADAVAAVRRRLGWY